MPAVFVVDPRGELRFSHVERSVVQRIDPDHLLEVLRKNPPQTIGEPASEAPEGEPTLETEQRTLESVPKPE